MERREKLRIPLERECLVRVLKSGAKLDETSGETVNMSSSGILVRAHREFEVGTLLEVAIHWPAQINNHCGLKLVARARVVRSDAITTAAVIER